MSKKKIMKAQGNMKVTYVSLGKIKERSDNPRKHPESQIISLCESIKKYGFTSPIIVDESHRILAGHGRYSAAKRMKMGIVPCVIVPGLTAKQKKAYMVADNKIPLESMWDEALLGQLLEDLKDDQEIFTAFSELEIGKLLRSLEEGGGEEVIISKKEVSGDSGGPEEFSDRTTRYGEAGRTVLLLLAEKDYSDFIEAVTCISKHKGIPTNTEAIVYAVKSEAERIP